MDALNPDQVRAWSDAVGPTFMAFMGLCLLIVVLILPMIRRDKKESDVTLFERVVRLEERMAILWKDRNNE